MVIDMQNSNALISMAMVTQNNNNPYYMFCNYIEYCLYSYPSDSIQLSKLREQIGQEFGVYIPHNVLLYCLAQLEGRKSVEYKNHEIYRIGSFDTTAFDKSREEFRSIEKAIIDGLLQFVAKYGRIWDADHAREQLVKVLDANGLAFDIFMHRDCSTKLNQSLSQEIEEILSTLPNDDAEDESDEDNEERKDDDGLEPLFKDSFFVGKYIAQILSSETQEKDYLEKICEGLMLCAGAYQIPNPGAVPSLPQIRDTCFFFDTKLLLRFLGCSGTAAIEAVRELVKLIQMDGGKIYYYPQTYEEICRAFDKAIRDIAYGFPPSNNEMRLYAANVKNSISILQSKKASVKQELANASIFLTPRKDFTETERLRFGFNREELQRFMDKELNWEPKAIENDSWSIWETHMRRSGNYADYCGTSNCLPVFVTSNSGLIQISLAFRKAYKNISSISTWKSNRLPVITDTKLTCRLWSPATQCSKLSRLYLSANAVAAQRPTRRYINTIRELAKQLEENVPEYSSIPLPAFFDDCITNAILNETEGDESKLDASTFASSIQELAEWKAKEQEDKLHQTTDELANVSDKYDNQTQSIIDGAIEANKNIRGRSWYLLKLISWWVVLAPILFAGISAVISLLANSWTIYCGALALVVVFIISEFLVKRYINRKLLIYALPSIEKQIKNYIENNLRKSELPYKDEIVKKAIEQNEQLNNCRKKLAKAADS